MKEHEGDHDHIDPHYWLSVTQMKSESALVAQQLAHVDPTHLALYQKRHRALNAELTALDTEIRKNLAASKGKSFIVLHPFMGYFARDYGLHQYAIESEGKSPSPRQLKILVDQVKRHRIRVLIVQSQESPHLAQTVAKATGVKILTVDSQTSQYVGMMRQFSRDLAGQL